MAIRPTKLPKWATVPSIDPVVGGSNVVDPPDQQKEDGWARKQKPPANYTNWLFNTIYLWIQYLDAYKNNYGITTGTEPDYETTIAGIESYFEGLTIELRIHATTSGASTIDINGHGEVDLKKPDGSPIEPGDLVINRTYIFIHNGTNFVAPATTEDRGIAKAWARFIWTGSAVSILNSYGISGISRISTGIYRITFNVAWLNVNYIFNGNAKTSTGSSLVASIVWPLNITTTTMDIEFTQLTINVDPTGFAGLVFFGDR